MENFKVEWDGADGTRVQSVVSYSKRVAEKRRDEMTAEANATIVEVPIFKKRGKG
ncbi:hypothetical protein OHB41_48335 [Streptomyces sp. NBC_01571]|uniref:hypothetical protein n=1 Tax=Streptomyces sp. NBC_01571 TaxID=2975883 RepID=UPI0022507AE7|nr:hypothetical protein [Streptomyces sp. NBC_01571]MCX4580792.1 hypothetical protein [Streptomyces sp. NBC_01571]